MRYLLDTNVVSELRKPRHRCNPNVRAWVAERKPSDMYLSAITILEIELGITRIRRKAEYRAQKLQQWLEEDLLASFEGRIVSIDVAIARRTARLHVPDPRPERDALIGATAITHDLTVVTRNIRDFEPMGVSVINPWNATQN